MIYEDDHGLPGFERCRDCGNWIDPHAHYFCPICGRMQARCFTGPGAIGASLVGIGAAIFVTGLWLLSRLIGSG